MLRIDDFQVEALSEAFRRSFLAETTAFLRARRADWAQGRDDADIAAHIEEVTRFAHAHDLRNAASLQRLALLAIDSGLGDDPDGYPRALLRAKGFSEARRIANYIAARRKDAGLQRVRLDLYGRGDATRGGGTPG